MSSLLIHPHLLHFPFFSTSTKKIGIMFGKVWFFMYVCVYIFSIFATPFNLQLKLGNFGIICGTPKNIIYLIILKLFYTILKIKMFVQLYSYACLSYRLSLKPFFNFRQKNPKLLPLFDFTLRFVCKFEVLCWKTKST